MGRRNGGLVKGVGESGKDQKLKEEGKTGRKEEWKNRRWIDREEVRIGRKTRDGKRKTEERGKKTNKHTRQKKKI